MRTMTMTTMMTCSSVPCVRIAYATVCGERHRARHERNQDAVAVCEGRGYTVLCVADGVGSQRYARRGSHAAVRAVVSTFKDFVGGKIGKKEITATIFLRYKSALKAKYRAAASTTCVFAAIVNEHGLFVGQIGDGLCLVRINGESVFVSDKGDEFLNEVNALSADSDGASWRTKHYSIAPTDRIEILLTTDGLSGDIIPGRETECLEYFANKVDVKPRFIANMRLRHCLKDWGKTGSSDDKTAVIYKRTVSNGELYCQR